MKYFWTNLLQIEHPLDTSYLKKFNRSNQIITHKIILFRDKKTSQRKQTAREAMNHSNEDIKIADMLTRYVEELEIKMSNIESLVLKQENDIKHLLYQEKKQQGLLYQHKKLFYNSEANFSQLKREKTQLIYQAHLLSMKHDHELTKSILYNKLVKQLQRRNKNILELEVIVEKKLNEHNNGISCQFYKEDGRDKNAALQSNLSSNVFFTKSIVLQNEENTRKINEKQSEIEVTQRKLKAIVQGTGREINIHKIQFEICILNKNILHLKQSCTSIVKKIRAKRMT